MDVIIMVEIKCFIDYLRCLVRDLTIAPLHEDDELQRLFAVKGVLKFCPDYTLSIDVSYTGSAPEIRMISLYRVLIPGEYRLVWGWKRDSGEEWGMWR